MLCFLSDSIKPKVCGHCPRAPVRVPGPPWTSGRAACLPDYSGPDVVSVWRGHVPPGTFYLPSVCSHGCRYPGPCCAVSVCPFPRLARLMPRTTARLRSIRKRWRVAATSASRSRPRSRMPATDSRRKAQTCPRSVSTPSCRRLGRKAGR